LSLQGLFPERGFCSAGLMSIARPLIQYFAGVTLLYCSLAINGQETFQNS